MTSLIAQAHLDQLTEEKRALSLPDMLERKERRIRLQEKHGVRGVGGSALSATFNTSGTFRH